jgi:hypothetical protein
MIFISALHCIYSFKILTKKKVLKVLIRRVKTEVKKKEAICYKLESMHLDLVPTGNLILNKEPENLCPMITLQLNNLATNFILNHMTITSKFLLERLQDSLLVQIVTFQN